MMLGGSLNRALRIWALPWNWEGRGGVSGRSANIVPQLVAGGSSVHYVARSVLWQQWRTLAVGWRVRCRYCCWATLWLERRVMWQTFVPLPLPVVAVYLARSVLSQHHSDYW